MCGQVKMISSVTKCLFDDQSIFGKEISGEHGENLPGGKITQVDLKYIGSKRYNHMF